MLKSNAESGAQSQKAKGQKPRAESRELKSKLKDG
jgi:hypothetical protein